MSRCFICHSHDGLQQAWAFDENCWEQCPGDEFVLPQHTSRKDFCRTCHNSFEACRFCGDVAAAWWAEDDPTAVSDVCANPSTTCWPHYWETQYQLMGTRTVHRSFKVDALDEAWPGAQHTLSDDDDADADDDDADAGDDADASGGVDFERCQTCNTQMDAEDAITYHGDDKVYCLDCFGTWLADRDA